MKNISEVRDHLINVVSKGLVNGTVKTSVAKELNNSTGKIINTIKAELEYAASRKEAAHIPFLEYAKTAKKK